MAGWADLLRAWTERGVGFRMEERMAGTHRFRRDFPPGEVKAGTELPLSFVACWGHESLPRFLSRKSGEFLRAELEGIITAGGLCAETPIQGSIELRYFEDASVRYRFEFEAHRRRFRYAGEKRGIRPWNLHRTHTTCYGTITDLEDGELLTDSVTYFDLRDLPSFFASWRFR